MSARGHIIIIEDDHDDKDMLVEIIEEITAKHKIIWFDTCDKAYNYLCHTQDPIFIIFSDINLPKKNGLELKEEIDKNPELKIKSIPFVFYSTSASDKDVTAAYKHLNIQGFFEKENDYNAIKCNIKTIIDYWSISKRPQYY